MKRIFLINKMSWKDDFVCTYCEQNFKNNLIKLSLHIKDNHTGDDGKNHHN